MPFLKSARLPGIGDCIRVPLLLHYECFVLCYNSLKRNKKMVLLMQAFSTTARLLIGLNPDLCQRIIRSARQNPNKKTNILNITILSSDQMNQSLADPQNNSFKSWIKLVYVNNLQVVNSIIASQEKVEEQRIFIQEALNTLHNKLKSAPPPQKVEIKSAMTSLQQKYKLLNNIDNAYVHSSKQLTALETESNAVIAKHDEQWAAYRSKHLDELKVSLDKILEEAGLPPLPQGEIDNLLRQDSWQEVLDRFNDVGASKDLPEAELEKLIQLKKPSFNTYFRLKAYMAIRSVYPSREKISNYFNKLNDKFNEENHDGDELTAKQEGEVSTLRDKVIPISQLTDSNRKTVNEILLDSENILKNVTTKRDLEYIIEKTQAVRSEIVPERSTPKLTGPG